MARLTILNRDGDFGVDYSPEEHAEAQRKFEELVGQKAYFGYDVDESGTAKITKSFNPKAKEVVLVPRMVGG